MIQARGNNPLKFSAGDDDALAALLGAGRRTDMAPHEAVADALRDIRLHELASMAAMQSAVRAVLDGLDPAKLRAQAEQGGGMSCCRRRRRRAPGTRTRRCTPAPCRRWPMISTACSARRSPAPMSVRCTRFPRRERE